MTKRVLWNIIGVGSVFLIASIACAASWLFGILYEAQPINGDIIYYAGGILSSLLSVLSSESYLAYIEKEEERKISDREEEIA